MRLRLTSARRNEVHQKSPRRCVRQARRPARGAACLRWVRHRPAASVRWCHQPGGASAQRAACLHSLDGPDLGSVQSTVSRDVEAVCSMLLLQIIVDGCRRLITACLHARALPCSAAAPRVDAQPLPACCLARDSSRSAHDPPCALSLVCAVAGFGAHAPMIISEVETERGSVAAAIGENIGPSARPRACCVLSCIDFREV